MFKCIGKNFSGNVKLLVTNKNLNQKYFSVLYPVNCPINVNKKRNEFLKPHSADQIQFRCLSMQDIQTFTLGFYDAVTSSAVSKLFYDTLIQTHDVFGISWCSTILLSAFALKFFISFPAGIYQQHLVAKLKNLRTGLAPVVEKLKQEILVKAKRERWTKSKATLVLKSEVKKIMTDLVIKNNCHPFKSVILNLCQLPIWLIMSLTIRKFASDVTTGKSESVIAALQFQVGGPFWCSNLAIPDPTFIIPLLLSVTQLISVELTTLSPSHVLNLLSKITTYILRIFAVLSFLLSSIMPAGVSLFWFCTTALALAQNLLFMSPRFRRFFRIPKTALDPEKPYQYIVKKFKEKWF